MGQDEMMEEIDNDNSILEESHGNPLATTFTSDND